MSDDKFTKPIASALTALRDLVDWGVAGGHTTPDQLRLAVIPRTAIPELKAKGLSNRKIAKLTGVDEKTVRNDLGADFSALSADFPAPTAAPRSARVRQVVAGDGNCERKTRKRE